MLELRLLGGYEVVRDGRPLAVARARCGVVLAFLALARRPVARPVLAAALWPDSEEAQSRTNLRRELHSLRQALPGWEPDDWSGWQVDLHQLEDALAKSDDEAAVALYRGELLPGFFQDWALRERERLHAAVGDALERLVSARPTLALARALVRHDPLREESYRPLIRLHLAAGDRAAATAVLQECEKVLARELGVEPSAATRGLLSAVPLPSPTPRQPLVGRSAEWQRIEGWWREGTSRILLLEGEPGIGKTRLLAELEDHARGSGARVLTARAYEAERHRVHGLLLDALGQRGDVPADDLVTALAALGEGLLIIDDVQWADEPSLALLHYAARLLSPLRLAWGLRSGPDEGPAAAQLRRLVREGRVERIPLAPLTPDDIARVARTVGAEPENEEEFWRRCGGNPLYALELGRRQAVANEAGLAELIRARLDELGRPEREVLSWLAALGKAASLADLGALAEQPVAELDRLAEGLERTGLLRPLGTGYTFGLDVVREVAYASLSEPRRQLLHLRIARHLERPAEVARHALLGGDQALALASYATAAQQLLRQLAYRDARELARQGWGLARDLEGPEALETQLELLAVWVTAGAAPEEVPELAVQAERLVQRAREAGRAEHEASAHALLAWLQFGEDSLERVQASSRKMAEVVLAAGPQAQAKGLARTGYCLAAIGREVPRAEALLCQAQALAGEADIYEVQIGLGLVRWHQGQLAEGREWLGRALRHSRQAGGASHASFCLARLGLAALEAGDVAAAREHAAELARLAAQRGDAADEGCAHGLGLLADYLESGGPLEGLEERLCRVGSRRYLAHLLLLASEHDLEAGRDGTGWARTAARHAESLQDEDLGVRARALAGEEPAAGDLELSFKTRAVLDRVATARAGRSPA